MSVGGTQQPGTWHESIYQGDSWSKTVVTPWDLTGWTVALTIFGEGNTVLLALTTGAGGGITVGGTGTVNVYPTITATQSTALPLGAWPWAWVFTDTAGNVRTYIVGSLTVTARF